MVAMGIDINFTPSKQRILVINKRIGSDHRVILNHGELVDNIRNTFGVEVDYWFWDGESLLEQVKMSQKYTVCVTMCGSTSFMSQFLP